MAAEGYHIPDDSDHFPAFTRRFSLYQYPKDFKPVGITKYDGKQAPQQWLRCYSAAVELVGGTNTTKVIFFPMNLEAAPLTWLESLKPNTINSWEDLKASFIDNFQGAITHTGTCHDLSQCKQKHDESLRSYIKHFFDTRATIANISDQDIIDCFPNGISDQNLYRDFGHNRPKIVVQLWVLMQNWVDQEEQERERFPRCNNDNNGN